jgi:hypothetical protein
MMAEPLKRIGKKGNGVQYRQVNMTVETHEKLKEVCEREETTQVELVRYLIDLAHEGVIDLGGE